MEITFRPITRATFRDVVDLEVTPQQETFVAPNLYSIAEAYVEPAWTPWRSAPARPSSASPQSAWR